MSGAKKAAKKSGDQADAFALYRHIRDAILTPASRKSVLYSMAAFGNGDGTSIKPNMDTLGRASGVDERTARQAVDDLVDRGVVDVVIKRKGRLPSEYKINIGAVQRLSFKALNPGPSPGLSDTNPGPSPGLSDTNPEIIASNPEIKRTQPGSETRQPTQDLDSPDAHAREADGNGHAHKRSKEKNCASTRERVGLLWRYKQTGLWDPADGDRPCQDEMTAFERYLRDTGNHKTMTLESELRPPNSAGA